jgi:mono/diheme cytochrome c family protein
MMSNATRLKGLIASGAVALVLVAAACGGSSSSSSSSSTPSTSAPATSTTPATSTPATSTAASGGGNAAAGKVVFTSTCATCHTLADAGATGSVGPNLDQLKPNDALVIHQVTNGGGGMPAFGGQLSQTQIQDVAKYVSTVAGNGSSNSGSGGGGTP